MITTKTNTWCDICTKQIENEDELCVSEYFPERIIKIKMDIWYYGCPETQHICRSCSNKIIDFMRTVKGRKPLTEGWKK